MDPVERLTRREVDVLAAMSDGLSNEGIAARLVLSVKTVEGLIRSIFQKLDLHDHAHDNRRVRAVRIFLDAGLGRHPTLGQLPTPVSSFHPADGVVARCLTAVRANRLTTFVGPGGVGKTRMAVEVARLLEPDHPGGVWFIDLVPTTDEASLLAAVATALGVDRQAGRTVEQAIVDWCGGRRSLVVFDNCEHVLPIAARLIESIASGAPAAAVLATSREPLGTPGEATVAIEPLDAAGPGLQLLRQRAGRSVDPSGAPSGRADDASMEALCRAVDGLPLALEIVAARLRSTSTDDLARLVEAGEQLRLRNRNAGGHARHQSLHATIDWSYRRLDRSRQRVLERLSVFPASFDRAAAIAVAGPSEAMVSVEIDDALSDLVDASLVSLVTADGRRMRLLESVRLFAAERLEGRDADTRDAHLRHVCGLATALRAEWASPRQLVADAAFDDDWDNVRAALRWAIVRGDGASCGVLVAATAPHASGRIKHEHAGWAQAVIDAAPAVVVEPEVFAAAGAWALVRSELGSSADLCRRAIAAAPSADHPSAALATATLLFALAATGAADEAAALVPRVRAFAAGHPDPYVRWMQLFQLTNGRLGLDATHLVADLDALDELSTAIGAPSLIAKSAVFQLQRLGHGASVDELVTRLEQEALPLARAARSHDTESWCLEILAMFRGVTPGHPHLRRAISRLAELRYWATMWMAIDRALEHVVAAGDLRTAALVYGHLRARQPATPAVEARRDELVVDARTAEQFTTWAEHGASLGTHEFVATLLDLLAADHPQETSPV
jgi:predicted ATPase/DNA-binding CsgD family transcriptional regulator